MGERNDLIENPPVVAWIITDRNGFRSVTQSHVSAETMLRLGAEVTSLVRLSDFVALRVTIATLSEALAEAEKKGAEAREEAARIALDFAKEPARAFTRKRMGLAWPVTAKPLALQAIRIAAAIRAAPPRDLSQGCQP